jgi:hypothetical protein
MTQKEIIKKRTKEIEQRKKRMRERNDKWLKCHKLIYMAFLNKETGWHDYKRVPYVDTTKMLYDFAILYYPTEKLAIREVTRMNYDSLRPCRLLQAIFGGTIEEPPHYEPRYTKKAVKTGKDENKQKGNR